MKIAFVNDTIYGYATNAPVVGGAERQQWLLARTLAASGWSVTVGVRDGLRAGERRSVAGVEFVGIGQANIYSAWYRFLGQERPDWWYWRCASHLLGPAVEIAKRARVRTIYAAGFDTDFDPRRALSDRARWWPLYAWGLARTDRIFVQHLGQLHSVPTRWRHKSHVVRSFAGTLPHAVTPHRDRSKYVAWVAMLRRAKRPDLLAEIARRTPTVRFVVCGGATNHASPVGYSQRAIEILQTLPNVEFLGQVTPEEAHHTIANAALLLSTSDAEGFPNTFVQAWANGTPVVSLRVDPDGVIEQHQLGTVPGSVERAAADIVALMESPQRRQEMAARSRDYVAITHGEAAVRAAFHEGVFMNDPRDNTIGGDHAINLPSHRHVDKSTGLVTPHGKMD